MPIATGEGKLTAWERWELASLDAPKMPVDKPDNPEVEEEVVVVLPTAAEVEYIRQQAHDEGYREGRGEGYREGQAEGYREGQARAQDEAARLARAASQLERAMADLDLQVADELLALAVEIARQVVRGELAARPEAILDVVHDALAQLPHQHAAIFLHPDDASMVRSWQGDALTHAGHRIHEDARLNHGDCVIEAGGSQIDAAVATRWRRVLEGMGLDSAWKPENREPHE